MPNLPSAFTPVIAVDRDLPKPLQKIQIALTCFDVVKPQGSAIVGERFINSDGCGVSRK